MSVLQVLLERVGLKSITQPPQTSWTCCRNLPQTKRCTQHYFLPVPTCERGNDCPWWRAKGFSLWQRPAMDSMVRAVCPVSWGFPAGCHQLVMGGLVNQTMHPGFCLEASRPFFLQFVESFLKPFILLTAKTSCCSKLANLIVPFVTQ